MWPPAESVVVVVLLTGSLILGVYGCQEQKEFCFAGNTPVLISLTIGTCAATVSFFRTCVCGTRRRRDQYRTAEACWGIAMFALFVGTSFALLIGVYLIDNWKTPGRAAMIGELISLHVASFGIIAHTVKERTTPEEMPINV
jgi:hypothetical protein